MEAWFDDYKAPRTILIGYRELNRMSSEAYFYKAEPAAAHFVPVMGRSEALRELDAVEAVSTIAWL